MRPSGAGSAAIEQPVVAARDDADDGAGCVAAEAVGDQPLAGDEGARRVFLSREVGVHRRHPRGRPWNPNERDQPSPSVARREESGRFPADPPAVAVSTAVTSVSAVARRLGRPRHRSTAGRPAVRAAARAPGRGALGTQVHQEQSVRSVAGARRSAATKALSPQHGAVEPVTAVRAERSGPLAQREADRGGARATRALRSRLVELAASRRSHGSAGSSARAFSGRRDRRELARGTPRVPSATAAASSGS